MQEFLIQAGAVVAAITAIIVFVNRLVKAFRKMISYIQSIGDRLTTIEKHTKENYLTGLKLVIMSEEIPIEERLIAGEEYVNLGGNGQIKAKYHVLKEEYEEKEKNK